MIAMASKIIEFEPGHYSVPERIDQESEPEESLGNNGDILRHDENCGFSPLPLWERAG